MGDLVPDFVQSSHGLEELWVVVPQGPAEHRASYLVKQRDRGQSEVAWTGQENIHEPALGACGPGDEDMLYLYLASYGA